MAATSAIARDPEPASPAGQEAVRARWRQLADATPGTLLFECTAQGDSVHAAESGTLLFCNPHTILTAYTAEQLPTLLDSLEAALASGFYVAGYLTYEAACALEGSVSRFTPPGPLAWFGLYTSPDRLAMTVAAPLDTAPAIPLCLELETERSRYLDCVTQAQQFIADGDTYQVNLTTAVSSGYRGEVASLYTALARQQPTAFSALLHPAAGQHILSFSPELLFRTESDGRILTRPMKGTAPIDQSGASMPSIPAGASSPADWLQVDEKNRAEHVMIVDLLRNDLNRVAIAGSVHVDPLFAIERYGTVLQMTSTIAGQLRPQIKMGDILRALLPAGSMTGAPKHRTLQIIDNLEDHPRGVYSGAIGFAAPDGTSVFSVPIRTVALDRTRLRMGVGGGIVSDSQAEDELAECWLKCAFLHRAATPFDLVETFRWNGCFTGTTHASSADPRLAYGHAEDHLDRLEISAHRLGFRFDRAYIRASLAELASSLEKPRRIRLLLDRGGSVRFELSALDLWPESVALRVSPEIVWSGDTFLRHKTTYRPIYNRELERARDDGFADALFFNERGELSEGAISSVLLLLDGHWLTPPLSAGLLPGVARGRLLRAGQVTERTLTEADLCRAAAIVVANGVRGTAQVSRIQLLDGTALCFSSLTGIPRT